jgi:plasmid stabilization system protein ParE
LEAYAWYEEQQVGLGEEFLRCVDACIQSILRHPKSYEIKFKNYRRGLVRRFAYGVFYEYVENENKVIVYGIFHSAKNPEKWYERMSS